MTLILIDLPNHDGTSVIDGRLSLSAAFDILMSQARIMDDEATCEIDPSVYVVDYGSVENGPAVFAHREDAEEFATDRSEGGRRTRDHSRRRDRPRHDRCRGGRPGAGSMRLALPTLRRRDGRDLQLHGGGACDQAPTAVTCYRRCRAPPSTP
jgi:hypothetical protein